jgi:hypothetical protein
LHADPGNFSVEGMPADLVVRHAQEVMEAMDRLPPDAPLTKAERTDIRRELSVVTDGCRDEKRSAIRKLKRFAAKAAKRAVDRAVDRTVDAAAWSTFVYLLTKYFGP